MILLAVNFDNLHQILRSLYADMMPLCSQMTGVAKGLAGLGALFYVAYRVWQSLARAEPVDVFPLLRPFALGICIMFFPSLVPLIVGAITSSEERVLTLESKGFDVNGPKTHLFELKKSGKEPLAAGIAIVVAVAVIAGRIVLWVL